jgi:hypothetical protein
MPKSGAQLGHDVRTVQPKLRMIANGDLAVNTISRAVDLPGFVETAVMG